jgi:hypothetical protein
MRTWTWTWIWNMDWTWRWIVILVVGVMERTAAPELRIRPPDLDRTAMASASPPDRRTRPSHLAAECPTSSPLINLLFDRLVRPEPFASHALVVDP